MPDGPTLALIGPSGIGRVHARAFAHAGARIAGVLASTPERTARAAEALSERLGRPVRAFADIEAAVEGAEAVSICTPPALHRRQIEAALDRGRYVFCEKPLFWEDGLGPGEIEAACDDLLARAAGRLLVNVANTRLLEAFAAEFGLPARPAAFSFRFRTRGPYQGAEIGVDLLPHALSFLLRLAPEGRIENLDKRIAPRAFVCRFDYAGIRCRFDLGEDPDGAKALAFAIDGRGARREQAGSGDSYRVWLVGDDDPATRIALEDPFRTWIGRFVRTCARGGDFSREAPLMRRNMSLMAELMAAPARREPARGETAA